MLLLLSPGAFAQKNSRWQVPIPAQHSMPRQALILAPGEAKRVDQPPHLKYGNAPRYPVALRNKGIVGSAVIAFTVGIDGKPKDFALLSSTHGLFSTHAIAAVYRWRFEPARKNRRPVECRVQIPFRWLRPR